MPEDEHNFLEKEDSSMKSSTVGIQGVSNEVIT